MIWVGPPPEGSPPLLRGPCLLWWLVGSSSAVRRTGRSVSEAVLCAVAAWSGAMAMDRRGRRLLIDGAEDERAADRDQPEQR
jgi:hypothetical protein